MNIDTLGSLFLISIFVLLLFPLLRQVWLRAKSKFNNSSKNSNTSPEFRPRCEETEQSRRVRVYLLDSELKKKSDDENE